MEKEKKMINKIILEGKYLNEKEKIYFEE